MKVMVSLLFWKSISLVTYQQLVVRVIEIRVGVNQTEDELKLPNQCTLFMDVKNMEQTTNEIIESLELSQSQITLLVEAIEWEKELSWSNGYADAVDQLEETKI
jgi:hypothetical protein